jgi:hypothetical protein
MDILRMHRYLPLQMRSLGDEYVKAEFVLFLLFFKWGNVDFFKKLDSRGIRMQRKSF